ncbi:NRDC protein, partial [Acromyrmex charruanus]
MVFKGSKKYPENFNEYVSLYDGTTDSETDCEYTRFYFDISVKQLEPALDHFVQFFIDHPPLTKDAITREREVIENEFQSSCLSCDKNRKERVLSHIARIRPPPIRIQWKELTSYSNDDELYKQLHKFRESQYSAHKMMLTIQARLLLDTLEKYVTDSFAGIIKTMNIMNFGDDLDLDTDTPCFKAYCSIRALPKERIEYWKSIEPLPDFNLPLFNASLIDNISLIPVSAETSKYPVKLYYDDILEIWYRPKFYWPMCHINLHIVCSLKIKTSKDAALLDMYCNVLKYLLTEELNPAIRVGFDYDIDVSEEAIGITIQMSGFGQKLPVDIYALNCVGEVIITHYYQIGVATIESSVLIDLILQEKRLLVILENSQLESVKKNVLIEINPQTRISRTFKRFAGLICKLLNPRDFVPTEDLVILVGAMAHGQVKTDYTEDISINNYPLSGAIACNQLCKTFEEVWGVV